MVKRTISDAQRFWAKVRKGEDCWEWTASLNRTGYGYFFFASRICLAHRVAWTLANGDPGNLLVLHHCDNPKCVRIDHLFVDMEAKGRRRSGFVHGEKHGCAKLTEIQVLEIRELLAAGCTHAEIAARFAVSKSAITAISIGWRWSWLRRSA
jgi:hypothetical protein